VTDGGYLGRCAAAAAKKNAYQKNAFCGARLLLMPRGDDI
jgi:hypothetical protein